MATAYDSEDDDFESQQLVADGFQDPSYFSTPDTALLVTSMMDMFPSVPADQVQRIVRKYGSSNQEMIVNELLRASDDASPVPVESSYNYASPAPAESSGAYSSPDSSPNLQPPRKHPKVYNYKDYTTPSERVNMRCELFRSFLPDADPDFLKEKARELGEDEVEIQEWLDHAMNAHDYPTLIEYLKRKEGKDALQLYTEMTPEDFLGIFPDGDNPGVYFSRRDRTAPSEVYKTNAATFLKILFPDADEKLLETALGDVKGLLVPAVNYLEASGCERAEMPSCGAFETGAALDLTFIQEMTFLRMQEEIDSVLVVRRWEREHAKAAAKEAGTLFECPICGEDDVLISDVLECNGGRHLFCSQCVKRQAEIAASEARSIVPCLQQCSGFFTLSQLRGIISPSLFNALLKAVQQQELKDADLGDVLAACPFCGFACEIEDQRVDVFKCVNPVCRIDSCRKCNKVSHGSVPCDKVETDFQTGARLMLEEKLTAAIVRHCPRCKKEVVKLDGCNLMTCYCGVKFCYLCRQEIQGYMHFDKGRCQTWIVSEEIHRRDLSMAVKEGKQDVRNKFGQVQLVHDPTADVEVVDM